MKDLEKISTQVPLSSWQEQLDEVMDEFDFERVHKAMVALKWKWHFPEEDSRVPNLGEVKRSARNRLWAAIKHLETGNTNLDGSGYCASGGFEARAYWEVPGVKPWLELRFIVASWETWD